MSRTARRPYTKSKAVDRTCRGRGGCPWCVGNRRHASEQRLMAAKQRIVEAAVEWGDSEVGDDVGHLAAEIGLSLALGELNAAREGSRIHLVMR